MTLEELRQEIEERSREEIKQVQERGESEAAIIAREGEEKAASVQKMHMDRAREKMRRERIQSLYTASSDMKTRINREKERIFLSVFEKAGDNLAILREKDSYKRVFQNLVEESIRTAGEENIILHVDGRDEKLCTQILGNLGLSCDVVSDLKCDGGVNISYKDGHATVYNTFESRLERAREILKLEIYATLYGD
ncbi:MAG: V-type ATP synthase subunit E [Methanomicrobiaceae archaeon]|nr:V-type ATP synthase subunit E [Methanomicrobiaceae archaeon]